MKNNQLIFQITQLVCMITNEKKRKMWIHSHIQIDIQNNFSQIYVKIIECNFKFRLSNKLRKLIYL